ncbi:MAG TPA: hypothetical protein VEM35_03350, partial [Rhizomicrobium sp.]|nr:hypothetical protein [Rhizomicrobium sp.]
MAAGVLLCEREGPIALALGQSSQHPGFQGYWQSLQKRQPKRAGIQMQKIAYPLTVLALACFIIPAAQAQTTDR